MGNIFKKFAKAAKKGIAVAKNPSWKGVAQHVQRTIDVNTQAFSVGHIVAAGIGKTGKVGAGVEKGHSLVGEAIGDFYTLGGATALKQGLDRVANGEPTPQDIIVPLSELPEPSYSNKSYLIVVGLVVASLVVVGIATRKK